MSNFLIAAVAALVMLSPARAHWKPEYADAAPETRAWYETRTLNPDTRARLKVAWTSCCNHSDKVETQFRVEKTSAEDAWYWLDTSTNQWRRVPPDVIHYGDPAPDNQPTLFVYQGIETCFFPPEGGV